MRTLLVIDDDEVDRKAVARALRLLDGDYRLREAWQGRQGLDMALAESFDCILVDNHLPDISGLDLLVELRERLTVPVPIVMLTGEGNELIAVEAMKRGAYDYLPKSQLGPNALSRVIAHAMDQHALQQRLAEAQEKLERLALYDSLTGLGNRNLFHRELQRAIAISNRKTTSFVLVMMDLDRFKLANDTFGHEAGDAILAAIGRRLHANARVTDSYFRLGGDEFAAILEADSDGEAGVARIVAAITESVQFGDQMLSVGVSVGLATYHGGGVNAEALIRAADAAMYEAKKSSPSQSLAPSSGDPKAS